jgi:hypothetical protein
MGGITRSPYARIVTWWAASRVVVVAAAVAADALGWPRDTAGGPLDLLAAWDGGWYRLVAERGYFLLPYVQSDAAFFPLFPALLVPAERLGLPLVPWSLALANAFFLAGLLALYRLGRVWLASETAERAAVYAAVFPFSFLFSMAYPESLVLAATAAAGLAIVAGAWPACALAVAAAALARPQGALAALPVALATREAGATSAYRRGARWAAALAAPAALAVFSVYLWRTVGDPLAWSRAQLDWGRSFSSTGPVQALRELWLAPDALSDWLHPRHTVWLLRDALFLVLMLALVVVAARRSAVPRAWIAFGALVVVLPLASGSFVSSARFAALSLPAYWGLALLGERAGADRLIKGISVALLGLQVLLLPAHHP